MKNKAKLTPLDPAVPPNQCRWFRRMSNIWTPFLLLATLSLTACGRTIEWKQEVRLHDGRVIVVNRVSKQTGKIFPENTIIEYEKQVTFIHPDTGEHISWTLPKGTGSYLLDFDSGIPYYVLSASSVKDYNDWGCPNPPWIIYRYERGGWNHVSFEQLPAKFDRPNLLPAAKSDPKRVEDGYVTVDEFSKFLGEINKSYQVISREKVNPIGKGCHESVLIGRGRQSEIDNRR